MGSLILLAKHAAVVLVSGGVIYAGLLLSGGRPRPLGLRLPDDDPSDTGRSA